MDAMVWAVRQIVRGQRPELDQLAAVTHDRVTRYALMAGTGVDWHAVCFLVLADGHNRVLWKGDRR